MDRKERGALVMVRGYRQARNKAMKPTEWDPEIEESHASLLLIIQNMESLPVTQYQFLEAEFKSESILLA